MIHELKFLEELLVNSVLAIAIVIVIVILLYFAIRDGSLRASVQRLKNFITARRNGLVLYADLRRNLKDNTFYAKLRSAMGRIWLELELGKEEALEHMEYLSGDPMDTFGRFKTVEDVSEAFEHYDKGKSMLVDIRAELKSLLDRCSERLKDHGPMMQKDKRDRLEKLQVHLQKEYSGIDTILKEHHVYDEEVSIHEE